MKKSRPPRTHLIVVAVVLCIATLTAATDWADAPLTRSRVPQTNRAVLLNGAGATYTWIGGAGDWHTATNWTPTGIPGPDDIAIVDSGTPDIAAGDSLWHLYLHGGTITGAGNLTVLDSMEWNGGVVAGAGTLFVDTGAGLHAPNGVVLDRDMINDGTIYWRGGTYFQLDHFITLINNGTFKDETTTDGWLIWHYGYMPIFVNNGTFIKSGESETAVAMNFTNDGEMELQAGSFFITQYTSGGPDTGPYRIHTGADLLLENGRDFGGPVTGNGTLRLNGLLEYTTFTFRDTLNITGQTRMGYGTVVFDSSATVVDLGPREVYMYAQVYFGTGNAVHIDSLRLVGHRNYSYIHGTDDVHIHTHMQWSGGAIGGASDPLESEFIIDTGATVDIDDDVWLARTLVNEGTVNWLDGQISMYTVYGATFQNDGYFREQTTSDQVISGGTFANNFSYLKESTYLNTANTNFVNASSAALSGYGTIDFTGSLTNDGLISPGIADTPGLLTLGVNYPTSSTSWLRIDLNGYTGGVDHDSLVVNGAATLGGTMFIVVNPSFTPVHDDTFTVMTFDSRTGEFEQIVSSANSGCDFFAVEYTDTTALLVYHSEAGNPPVAARDEASTPIDTPADVLVLENDTDADGDTLRVSWLGVPLHGEATVVGDTMVSYTPDPGYLGLDSLEYEINDEHGCIAEKEWVVVNVYDPTGIGPTGTTAFALRQNFPNPFNPTTTITYELPTAAHVTLSVYGPAGDHLETLIDGVRPAGIRAVTWDAAGYPTGVYFIRLEALGTTKVTKAILLK